jgi:hypothetical protein
MAGDHDLDQCQFSHSLDPKRSLVAGDRDGEKCPQAD